MRTLLREARFALRRLRHTPVFAIAATTTLAVGIGATASVFSVVDGVLFKSFPYRAPDRILTIWESNPDLHQPQSTAATANYFDWAAQSRRFSSIAAACCGTALRMTIIGSQEPERVPGLAVTSNYFQTLGITPILGRPLAPDTSGPNEVVISYEYWQRRFEGERGVIGRRLAMINGNDARPTPRHTYTIVGVMPRGLPGGITMWTLIYFEPGEEVLRDGRYLDVYGRLAPHATAAGAQRELETIAARLAATYPKTNAHWSVVTVPLIDKLVGPVRPALLMLFGVAICVLLIGAANLANLFLVRCLAREREMAVRTALGASRRRLLGELLMEASLIGLTAAAGAVGLAVVGVGVLRRLAPPTLPRLSDIRVDGTAAAFCALAAVAMVLIFGLVPAWRGTRTEVADALKEGGRGTGSAQQHRLQDALVVLQVAVAFVLLVTSGLLVESIARFLRMDPGFQPNGVLTAGIALSVERYPTPESRILFFNHLLDDLRAQPGIQAVSLGGVPGYSPDVIAPMPFTIIGSAMPDPAHTPSALPTTASPDYFKTMGIKLLRGRVFFPSDDRRAAKVAVVNALLAQRFFGGRDPVGRQIIFQLTMAFDTVQIVGVVGTVKPLGLVVGDVPVIYLAHAQYAYRAIAPMLELRTAGDPMRAAGVLRRVLAKIDPNVPTFDVKTESDRLMQSIGTTRFATFLASLFAIVAVLLGAVGIYSVLAYVVVQRRREIAVQLALGAHASRLIWHVAGQGLGLTGLGVAIGVGAGWALTQAMASLFLGVGAHDPVTFVGGAAFFCAVAVLASSIPAIRATRVDPAVVLSAN